MGNNLIHIDLMTLFIEKVNELGPEEAAKFFGRGTATIQKCMRGNLAPDVSMCQKLLDEQLAKLGIQQTAGDVFENPPMQGATKPPPEEKVDGPKKPFFGENQKPVETGEQEVKTEPLPAPEPVKKDLKRSPYAILLPTNRDFNFSVVMGILGNWKSTVPEELREYLASLDGVKDTVIHHARNVLADRFMETGREWSIWFDSDNVQPIGNPAWYRSKTKKDYPDHLLLESSIQRLTKHGKPFVGGIYIERNGSGEFLVAGARKGDNDEEGKKIIADARKGPKDRIVARPWLAFGCCAVHRSVFEDIMERCPELKPKRKDVPWAFFTPYEGGPHGEDVTFAKHAIKAGHQPFLDCGLIAGHIGTQCFMP